MNLTGQFLISMPSLQDERFEKTVIYMCAHSKDGAMGIIINKKIDYDLYPDLLEQLGIDKHLLNKKLYLRYGGPVESGRGFVLHSDEVIQKETLSIEKGVALTSTSEFFEDLSKGRGPKNSILALSMCHLRARVLRTTSVRLFGVAHYILMAFCINPIIYLFPFCQKWDKKGLPFWHEK